jgi:hypothetical protein
MPRFAPHLFLAFLLYSGAANAARELLRGSASTKIKSLVVFGDSLSDTGEHFLFDGQASAAPATAGPWHGSA